MNLGGMGKTRTRFFSARALFFCTHQDIITQIFNFKSKSKQHYTLNTLPSFLPCCREVMLRGDLRLSLLERPCCREVMLREDLRLSLPERPCCREVMLREDLRLSLPERPCCREVMLREDLRLSLPERPCCREVFEPCSLAMAPFAIASQ